MCVGDEELLIEVRSPMVLAEDRWGTTAAIRLRVDIRGGKPAFFALSPPLAKHISRALRRAAKDYLSNVKNGGRGGPRGRAAGDYRR